MYDPEANRYFSSVAGSNKWEPSAGYFYSSDIVVTGNHGKGNVVTGAWIPVEATSDGRLKVDVGSVSFTGSIEVDNVPVVNAIASGNAYAAPWQKVSSSGYVSQFQPLVGSSVVSKINGISKSSTIPSYIQVYDGATGAGCFPVASVSVLGQNNWFIDFAENGVVFNSGVNIINSTDGVLVTQYTGVDFFASVVYR